MRKRIESVRTDPVFANSFWLMANTVVLTGFGFFFWTIVARFYDAHQVGLASTLISSMNLIVSISGLGLGVALIRFLPTSREPDKNINTLLLVSTLLALCISSLYVAFSGIFTEQLLFVQKNLYYGIFFVIGVIATLLFNFIDNIFLSYSASRFTLIKSTIFSVLKMAFPPLLLFLGVFGIFGSWVLATIIGLIVGVFMLMRKRYYRPRLEIHENILFDILPFTFGNYLSQMLRMLPTYLFPLLITAFLAPEFTAYYYTTYMIAGLLLFIPNMVSSIIVAEGSKGAKAYRAARRKAMMIFAGIMLPAAAGLFVLAPVVLGFLGSAYSANGTPLLRLYCVGSFLAAINAMYSSQFIIEKRTFALFIRSLVSTSTIFISWFIIFKDMGLIGVGYAWIAGMAMTIPLYAFDTLMGRKKKQLVRKKKR